MFVCLILKLERSIMTREFIARKGKEKSCMASENFRTKKKHKIENSRLILKAQTWCDISSEHILCLFYCQECS